MQRLTSRNAPSAIDGTALFEARLAASTTGRTASARTAFAHANAALASWVEGGEGLDRGLLCALNGVVRGLGAPSTLRRDSTTLDGYACPGPAAIAPLLEAMHSAVDERSRTVHVIAGAGLVYQWLATVHPFDDGNGRTARLAVDLVLARAGLPPACIDGSGAAHVAVRPENAVHVTPRFAVEVILRGLERTEELLWPRVGA